MRSVTEGRLALQVPDTWRVVKWDDTVDYREGIGKLAETKALDFVAVDAIGRLVLVELKDFRDRSDGGPPVAAEYGGRRKQLPDEVALKVRDTLAGLWGCLASNGPSSKLLRPVIFEDVRVVFVLAESTRRNVHRGKSDARRSSLQAELKRRLRWLTNRVIVVGPGEPFWDGCVVAV